MAHPQPAWPHRSFPYWKWSPIIRPLCDEYRTGAPCHHICLADFLEKDVALAVASRFPRPSDPAWVTVKSHNQDQRWLSNRDLLPPRIRELVDELNSPDFVAWLTDLSGIPGLVADPDLTDAGLRQAGQDGYHNLHLDSGWHGSRPDWRRRVNLVVYLALNWNDKWGGRLEFWDSDIRTCVAHYPSMFNHAVIFNADDGSFHGFPEPLRCPPGGVRNSLVLSYYTNEGGPKLVPRPPKFGFARLVRPGRIWVWKRGIRWKDRLRRANCFLTDALLGKRTGVRR
jgi:hypothetical protein